MPELSLAEKLFEVQRVSMELEVELESRLMTKYGPDWYDVVYYTFDVDTRSRSIEVYFEGRVPGEEDAAFFISLGFQGCRLHPHRIEDCDTTDCGVMYRTRNG